MIDANSVAKKENIEKMIEYVTQVADGDADEKRLYRWLVIIFSFAVLCYSQSSTMC